MIRSAVPATGHHPKVGWFELFYDLVIVAAVGYSSHEFIAEPTWAMGGWIAVSLLVMFLLWLLTSLGSNLYPGDHPARRLLGLVQMLALVVAALSSGRDGGLPDSTGFVALAVAFATVAGIYAIAVRSGLPGAGHARPIIVSSSLAAMVLLVGAVVPASAGPEGWGAGPWILGIGVAVAALPLLGPFIGRLCRQGRIDEEHLGERVGQLVIIVLGESFVSLVAALSDEPDIPNPLFLVLTFAVVFAIWTLYFSSVMPAGVPGTPVRLRAWLGGHWLLMFGAVGAAGGFPHWRSSPLTPTIPAMRRRGRPRRWYGWSWHWHCSPGSGAGASPPSSGSTSAPLRPFSSSPSWVSRSRPGAAAGRWRSAASS